MAASKPFMVTNVDPMRRIVQQANCGLIYIDYDTESFTSKLLQLQDISYRKELGLNGIKAVREHYNWDNDSTVMLEGVKKVLKQ